VLTLGNAIDADVTVGSERIPMRLCGTHVPHRGYCFYLTNLSRSLGPRQVADIYRVRWEIQLNNKLDKSSHRLDEIDARTPAVVNALIHPTIASVLVGLIVHCHNLAIAQTKLHHTHPAATPSWPGHSHARHFAPSASPMFSASTNRRPTPSGSISLPSSSMLAKTQLATQAVHPRPVPRLDDSASSRTRRATKAKPA
jgi:hypothetical protein